MAEVFGTAASALAVIELAAKVTERFVQYAEDVSNARDDIERIKREVTDLKNVTEEKLYTAVQGGEDELQKLDRDLAPGKRRKAMRRFGFRALKWPFRSKEVQKKIDIFRRCSQTISVALQVDEIGLVLDINDRTFQIQQDVRLHSRKAILGKLPVAQGAAFDSHAEEHSLTCLPDTRVDLLREIDKWVQDPNAKAIFWLNGMAGTGKSTISRTLAQTASASGCLGATFFFKRGEGDRGGVSKFLSTLAAQLRSREPAVIPHIQAAIDSDPAIFGKAMREQIEKLIFQPLSKISGAADKDRALLIVVDALDECEHEEDVKRFIHLFSNSKSIQSPRLKIFLTSRPDLPMHLGFTAIKEEYQHFILHKVATSVIEHDIQVFFNSELTRVKNDYNASVAEDRHIPAVWPSEDDMRILVKMAVPLFIFAATVCR
ncbi:WD40-repeat-containing domain protein [Apiospora arundinis]|uniref:WD40-repeat-containing domain protein n=1 Tax=Apiospora arundinis TaxID=335852 RepID=A0ABR2J310_9PEZI